MKKKVIYLLLAMIFMLGGSVEVQAQRNQGNKKYWKQVEKAEKDRAKYIRKQNKNREKYYKDVAKLQRKYYKGYKKIGPPPWAKAYGYDARHHVYFADYRTFYDPYRGGYVFLNDGNWSFSVEMPSFMINVNLGNARTRIIREVPISKHPEYFYYDYDDGYWD